MDEIEEEIEEEIGEMEGEEEIGEIEGEIEEIDEGEIEIENEHNCTWKYQATTQDNLVQCGDGTYCYWNFATEKTTSTSTKCCNTHGGRKICPKNFPTMCASKTCGGGDEYCCEASEYYCDFLYPTIVDEDGLPLGARECSNEPKFTEPAV